MFEPISEGLTQIANFSILGFFLAAFYEPLRIVRLFKRQGAFIVGIQDFFFFSFSGIITFAYSMELGSGNFRFFYIIGELFGAVLYLVTVGRLISAVSGVIVKCIKWFINVIKTKITLPILNICYKLCKFLLSKFVTFYRLVINKTENITKGLKSTAKIVYNKKKQENKNTENMMNKTGEVNNVVKARIRAQIQKKA